MCFCGRFWGEQNLPRGRLTAWSHACVAWQMIRSFGEGKMFYCAVFHPDDDKQNVVLAGCGDKKVYQWDADTGDLVQVGGAGAVFAGPCLKGSSL